MIFKAYTEHCSNRGCSILKYLKCVIKGECEHGKESL